MRRTAESQPFGVRKIARQLTVTQKPEPSSLFSGCTACAPGDSLYQLRCHSTVISNDESCSPPRQWGGKTNTTLRGRSLISMCLVVPRDKDASFRHYYNTVSSILCSAIYANGTLATSEEPSCMTAPFPYAISTCFSAMANASCFLDPPSATSPVHFVRIRARSNTFEGKRARAKVLQRLCCY